MPGWLPEPTDPPRPPWRALFLILLLALGLRVAAIERSSDVIGADSYRFLAAAEHITDGNVTAALADPYHPLTAFLIAGVDRAQTAVRGAPADVVAERARRELSGWIVSLLAGLIVVGLAIDLAARLFPGISPLAVGVLASVQPYFVRASADIMSDMIHLAAFLLALSAAARALGGTRWVPFAVTGAAAGLAYLARPEAVLLVPVIGGWWVLSRPWAWRTFIPRAAVTLGIALAFALPYSASIGWRLTGKKDVGSMMGLGEGAGAVVPGGGVVLAAEGPLSLAGLGEIFGLWFGTTSEFMAPAALGGLLVLLNRRERPLGLFVYGAVAALMVVILLRLILLVGDPSYLSRRHVYLLVFLGLPFSVRGLQGLAVPVGMLLPARTRPWVFAVLLGIVAASIIPKAIAPHRADQRMQRVVGEYILAHGGPGQVVFSGREKVAYYAIAELRGVGQRPIDEVLARLTRNERAWLVFYRERLERRVPDLDRRLEGLGEALRFQGRWTERGARRPRHLELYLYERPVPGTASPGEPERD